MRGLVLFIFCTPVLFALTLAFFVCSYYAILDMTLSPFNPFEWTIDGRKAFAFTWLGSQAVLILSWLSED